MNATLQAEPIKILFHKWTLAVEEPPTPSAPATAPKSRINYIFFRPANKLCLASTKVIDEPVASDHLPVFAELELLNRAEPALNQDEDRPRTIKPAPGIPHKQGTNVQS
jgi:hypothetical protein